MLYEGRDGVKKDQQQGLNYIHQAADANIPEFINYLKNIDKNKTDWRVDNDLFRKQLRGMPTNPMTAVTFTP